jgi:hypothetical protein
MADWLNGWVGMIARAASWIGALVIIVLSVVPAVDRPVTGAGSSNEHVAAFALVGGLFGIGYRISLVARFTIALLFCGGIELLQAPLPTRHARLSDFVTDVAASWCAIALVLVAERLVASSRSRKI